MMNDNDQGGVPGPALPPPIQKTLIFKIVGVVLLLSGLVTLIAHVYVCRLAEPGHYAALIQTFGKKRYERNPSETRMKVEVILGDVVAILCGIFSIAYGRKNKYIIWAALITSMFCLLGAIVCSVKPIIKAVELFSEGTEVNQGTEVTGITSASEGTDITEGTEKTGMLALCSFIGVQIIKFISAIAILLLCCSRMCFKPGQGPFLSQLQSEWQKVSSSTPAPNAYQADQPACELRLLEKS